MCAVLSLPRTSSKCDAACWRALEVRLSERMFAAAGVMILAMFLALHASTTQGSTDALQAELALARSTLASVRALVPRLQAATASELTSMPGYQGYTFVGASAAIEKSITVVLP